MLFRPPLDLGLNRVKGRHVNNRFMAICHRIFGKLTCIHNLPLGNMILSEGLLQEQVSCVGDIPENPLHAGCVPLHRPTEMTSDREQIEFSSEKCEEIAGFRLFLRISGQKV